MLLFLNESKLMMIVMIVMMIVMTVMTVIMNKESDVIDDSGKWRLLWIWTNQIEECSWETRYSSVKSKTRVELINFINDVFVRWVSQVLRRETGFWPALSSQPSSSSSTKSQIICSIRLLSQKNICPEMLVTSCDDVGADNITIKLNNDAAAAAADSDDDAGSILCWGKYLPQKRNYFIYSSLTLPNRIIDLV